jgi:crossover junction endodeoxyribonuclease RuvC
MGIGIVEKEGSQFKSIFYETLEAPSKASLPDRLHYLFNELSQAIKIYRPQVLAVENVFFSQNVQTAIKIGEARALALLVGTQYGMDIHEYPPARVKQSVVGNGRASKEQVQRMVKILLGLKEIPKTDAADGLAIALCYFHTNRSNFVIPRSKATRNLKVRSLAYARDDVKG